MRTKLPTRCRSSSNVDYKPIERVVEHQKGKEKKSERNRELG